MSQYICDSYQSEEAYEGDSIYQQPEQNQNQFYLQNSNNYFIDPPIKELQLSQINSEPNRQSIVLRPINQPANTRIKSNHSELHQQRCKDIFFSDDSNNDCLYNYDEENNESHSDTSAILSRSNFYSSNQCSNQANPSSIMKNNTSHVHQINQNLELINQNDQNYFMVEQYDKVEDDSVTNNKSSQQKPALQIIKKKIQRKIRYNALGRKISEETKNLPKNIGNILKKHLQYQFPSDSYIKTLELARIKDYERLWMHPSKGMDYRKKSLEFFRSSFLRYVAQSQRIVEKRTIFKYLNVIINGALDPSSFNKLKQRD